MPPSNVYLRESAGIIYFQIHISLRMRWSSVRICLYGWRNSLLFTLQHENYCIEDKNYSLWNGDIFEKLDVFNIQNSIAEIKETWVPHLNLMPLRIIRPPKEVWQYWLNGQRRCRKTKEAWVKWTYSFDIETDDSCTIGWLGGTWRRRRFVDCGLL